MKELPDHRLVKTCVVDNNVLFDVRDSKNEDGCVLALSAGKWNIDPVDLRVVEQVLMAQFLLQDRTLSKSFDKQRLISRNQATRISVRFK